MKKLEHKHIVIRAIVKTPPDCPSFMKMWLRHLIEEIGMEMAKVEGNPMVWYCNDEGNRGMTALALITTSHISLHSWDEGSPGIIQMDVYSCADFDPNVVLQYLEFFHPEQVDWKIIERNDCISVR